MNIGIVAEGPRDFDVFTEVIEYLSPNKFTFFPIQPNISETEGFGSYGAGWKGVLNWCEQFSDTNKLSEYLNSFVPKIDVLIVHIDADVSREAEIDCYCGPLNIQDSINNLKELLDSKLLGSAEESQIIYCIPSDNTEAWILCAFEPDLHNPPIAYLEGIQKPDYLLASKEYKLLKLKSNGKVYKSSIKYHEILIPKLVSEWDSVTKICTQAREFSLNINSL